MFFLSFMRYSWDHLIEEQTKQRMEKITFRNVIKFPLELWLLIICVICYVTVDPFLGLAVCVSLSLSVIYIFSLFSFSDVAGHPVSISLQFL